MNNLKISITSSNYIGQQSTRLTDISKEEIKMFRPLVKAILENTNHYNWTSETELVKNGPEFNDWETRYKVFNMYKDFSEKLIKEFIRHIPNIDADRIDEIKLAKTQYYDF